MTPLYTAIKQQTIGQYLCCETRPLVVTHDAAVHRGRQPRPRVDTASRHLHVTWHVA